MEENLQDIPMSVQVLSTDYLDATDLTWVYDLQFSIPGLVVNNLGLNGAGFSLRGIGDQGGTGASVARHLDGVYLGSSQFSLVRLFDMERIEVLKGPQGTLYGRDSTGGSINMLTRTPEQEFSAAAEIARGSFDTVRSEGHVNLAAEGVAFRLAFTGSEGDGYIRNSVDDRRFAESDYWGLRASVRLDVGERLRFDLAAQRVVDDGAMGELWLPQIPYLPDPDDIHLTSVTLPDPFLHIENDNVSLRAEYDLDFGMLRSITGYARNDLRDRDDCDASPNLAGCIRSAEPSNDEQWSQEFQLAGNRDGALDWLAGANLFNGESFVHFYNLVPARSSQPRHDADWRNEVRTYALFGQAAWRFYERWSVTAGLRVGHEERVVSSVGTGFGDPPALVTERDDWTGGSWRLDLEYAAAPTTRLYANVATGRKSGGFSNQLLPTGRLDNYDDEDLIAYETGAKFRSEEGHVALNATAFYYDFENLQVSTTNVIDGIPINETDNAATAKIYGIDLDAAWQPIDRLTLSAAVVWLPEREFTDYRNDQTGDVLSGNDLIRSPEWSGTASAAWLLPVSAHGDLSARFEYNYRSAHFFFPENNPEFAQGAFGLLNLFLRYEPRSAAWYAFVTGRNLTDEDYFQQVFIQASPGYPDTYEVGVGVRF